MRGLVTRSSELERQGVISADDIAVASQLAETIYDAGLEPDQWPDVLARCRDFVGGLGADILIQGVGVDSGYLCYQDGQYSAEHLQSYFGEYVALDVAAQARLVAPVGQAIAAVDVEDLSEIYDSRFYQEWAAPQHTNDYLAAPIARTNGQVVLFGISRHEDQGPIDGTFRGLMGLLIPHVRRAARVTRELASAQTASSSLAESLDALSAGLFLLHADGRLVHANAAARTMLGALGPLELKAGKIGARSRADGPAFSALLGGGPSTVTLRDADDGIYAAYCLPLSAAARHNSGLDARASTALFVHRATFVRPQTPEIIARAYGLTISEQRVMMKIVDLGSVPDVADALGLAVPTVKTHLQHVFAKTDTTRQSELVRLVAGFSGPLAR